MLVEFHFLVDEQDLPVFANDKRPARREFAFAVRDTVRCGNLECGIAQNWIIQLEFFGELLVYFGIITTGGEVFDVELTKGLAVLTERNAFFASPTGEGFGIPGDHQGALSHKV